MIITPKYLTGRCRGVQYNLAVAWAVAFTMTIYTLYSPRRAARGIGNFWPEFLGLRVLSTVP